MTFPLGKLPPDLVAEYARRFAPDDPRVLLGPGVGLDCAVIDFGDRVLVAKTDPITFTSGRIGWYAVQVNANDVATTGAQPSWFLVTALLPEAATDRQVIDEIFGQIDAACHALGATFVGGHTEVTAGLRRPILVGTMFGEVSHDRLVTPRGAKPGDVILLTKWIPIEATSILGAEFADRLSSIPPEDLAWARDVLDDPGISIVREAQLAVDAGGVTAMHDPTESGLAGGVWEMAEAAGVGIEIEQDRIPIAEISQSMCEVLDVDPLSAIASGSLLITARPEAAGSIEAVLQEEGIAVTRIGRVIDGKGVTVIVDGKSHPLARPPRDSIARLFESAD
jgi:hydrogenase expression/formation protein HypE